MRKAIFWTGCILMLAAPIAAIVEVAVLQDVPVLSAWKLAIPVVAFALILFGRNRDDVLKHHLGTTA